MSFKIYNPNSRENYNKQLMTYIYTYASKVIQVIQNRVLFSNTLIMLYTS